MRAFDLTTIPWTSADAKTKLLLKRISRHRRRSSLRAKLAGDQILGLALPRCFANCSPARTCL